MLEELQAAVTCQLPGWVEREDTAAISNAFRKAVQLRSADGGAAMAARISSGIIADLSAAYLPLVPRIRKAIDCRMPLWALGKAGIGSKGPEAQLANALLQRLLDPAVIAAATPMDLSLALYALGKLREDWQRQGGAAWDPAESDSVGALADEIKGRLTAAVGHGFNAQDVSNSLWACAKLGLADAELLQRLAEAGAAAAGNMTPQALSNSLWALEALGCTGPAYRSAVQVLCGEALRRLRTPELAEAFNSQHLSNILLALEGLQLGSDQAQLTVAVAAEDVRRSLAGYVAQDISNSAWALAKMGFGVGPEAPEEQRQWVTAALDAAMRPGTMATATPQAWANLLYALALMRHQPPPVLLDAGAAAMRANGVNGQECANTLYALAVLQLRHAGLEAAVCGRLGELLWGGKQALNHQDIANSLWAMAVFGETCSPDMRRLAIQLARDAASRWDDFTIEELTQLWQAQQELGGEVAAALRDSSSLQATMDAVVAARREETKPLHANQKQLIGTLRRLEQHGTAASDDETLEELQAAVTCQLPGWVEREDTAAISNAFRKAVQYRSGNGGAATAARIRSGIIADLSAAYLPLVPRIRKPFDCRMPLWALGKAGIGSKGPEVQLANALLQRLLDPAVIAAATAMDLSLALYALGKLREGWQQNGEGWDQSLGKLTDAIKTRLTAAVGHGFNAQDVSNSLWACAKLGLADADLLQRLAEAGAAVAGDMTPQALSNSLWALEALGCTGPAYRAAVQVLCGEALRRLRTPKLAEAFKPQDLSNILLALEGLQLGSEQAQLVSAVAAEDVRRGFTRYNSQDISNSTWALAKMGFGVGPEAPAEQRQWVTAALDAAMRPGTMATATPQNWSNLLYALSVMRHQPPPVLLDAGAAAAMRANSVNGPQDCANTLYALAVLQLRHAGLEAAVCGRLGELQQEDLESLTEQGLANSLWAVAVFGETGSPAMQQLAMQLARDAAIRWEEFADEGLTQLWQAQQALGGEVAAALRGNRSLQAAMDKAVATYREDTKHLPDDQKQLLAALRRLEQHGRETAGGLAVQSVQTGVVAQGVLTPVDAVMGLVDGRQVAVEMLGPKRFIYNHNQTLEELRAVVNGQLPGWVARKDNASIWRAFNKAAKLRSGDGGAATAARIRSGIIADLSAAYLPLGPAVCAAVECSIPLWAMAKVGISGQGKEAQLAAALLERLLDPAVLSTATPMDLSLALYALGKLREDWQQNGEGWDQSLGKLADAIKARLTAAVGHGFNAQDVSNALWACAKLGLADAELLQRLAQAGAAAAGNMTPQALSNSLWALEALGCTGPAYRSAIAALCGEAFRRLRTPELAAAFAPQHLSNILLALEGLQLGREKAQLVAAVAADGVRRGFAGFKPQELSNSAWALAKMGFGAGPEAPEEQRQWVSAAVDAAMRPGTMATATPQAWANLLYALALMRHQPPPALLQNAGAAAAMLSSGSGQNCANTLYALAVLQLRHAGLEAAVCGRLRELLRGDRQALNNQEVSNTLWAMAVLGGTSSPGMQQLAIQLARNAAGRWEGLIHEDLSQLWQAQQELGGEVAETLCGISSLQAAMDKSVETYRQDTKRLSETHKQLLAALRRLEQHQGREAAGGFAVVSVQAGVVAPGVLAAVDAVVRLNDGRQVAVELAGAVAARLPLNAF
eukprot:XP_001701154.1 predicted protein of CLR family [Chlamydomonas reinhardtii]